jgi:hypothetical protein
MQPKESLVILVISVLLVSATVWAATGLAKGTRLESSFAVRHDTSPPWRAMAQKPPVPGPNRVIELDVPARLANLVKPTPAQDPVWQTIPGVPAATPLPILSFDGQSDDDNAAVLGFRVVPPDTNGDVGPNHYVQWVNLIIAVYNKSTGARIFGPVAGNSIWSGFGGICESNNDGDPIAIYDHLADRWVISQFAIGNDGHQCVAVSTTPDPTGSYYRYDFVVSSGAFNDYPKFGVWPDAYYMSANQFTSSFQGAIAVAFERSKMLLGQPAKMVKFGPLPCGTECFYSIQPSDLDGSAPASGTPNTFIMSFDDETWGTGTNSDGYRLWNFHVDFTTVANSTFTALPQMNAPEFDANLCNFSSSCITQPAGGERLDSLSQFTMYRAQFRHFTTYESLVINHTVDVTGRNLAGVRWAELRKTGGNWSLYQTGTFSPDGNHRWMGSIAQDKQGNIAVGFSVSGRNTSPSIRYATRNAGDPLGQLGGEVQLVAGNGVQKSSSHRWGDYSSMSVDPLDGCTFWYTQEYYANNGSFDFKTRIGSFKVPGCN